MSPNKDIVERRVQMDSMILQQVAEKRELLLFFHGVFYEVAGALVLPASCG
jgi:hypothetical protein